MDSKRGGKREGAGRKIQDPAGEKVESRTYNATPSQHEKLQAELERLKAKRPK